MSAGRSLPSLWPLLKMTATAWLDDRAMRLAAALAYYSIFSLAPLIIIAISVAGFIFGEAAARGAISEQLTESLGPMGASAVENMINSARSTASSGLMTIVGIGLLIFSATGIFGQLKDAMNTIWGIMPKPDRGVRGMVIDRLLALIMVFCIGLLLMASLVITVCLSALSGWLGDVMPLPGAFWQALNLLVSFAVTTLLFAMIFKILPDADIRWLDVWTGAAITSLLFTLGKWGLSLYLGRESAVSTYGAAGAFVLILLWVHYSACILFFGAEFTQVYAHARGHEIHPNRFAIRIDELTAYKQRLKEQKQHKAERQALQNS